MKVKNKNILDQKGDSVQTPKHSVKHVSYACVWMLLALESTTVIVWTFWVRIPWRITARFNVLSTWVHRTTWNRDAPVRYPDRLLISVPAINICKKCILVSAQPAWGNADPDPWASLIRSPVRVSSQGVGLQNKICNRRGSRSYRPIQAAISVPNGKCKKLDRDIPNWNPSVN